MRLSERLPAREGRDAARLVEIVLALMIACGGCGSTSEPEPAASSPATASSGDLTVMRSVLRGDGLSDDEVRELDRVLRESGGEYTEDGLATFAEWELSAEVSRSDTGYGLYVVGGTRVMAEWQLDVDFETGRVRETSSSSLVEPPMDEPELVE